MLSQRNSLTSQNAELIEQKGRESSAHDLELRNPAERHSGEYRNAAHECPRRHAESRGRTADTDTSSVWIVTPSLGLTQNPAHNGDFAEFRGRTLAGFNVPGIVISKPWSGRDFGNKEKT